MSEETNIDLDRVTLLAFLADWLEWAESDNELAPSGVEYNRDKGLCANALAYGGDRLVSLLSIEFHLDGLDEYFPFGERAYLGRLPKTEQPERLAWVREKLA